MNSNTLVKAITLSGDPQQYPDSAGKYGTWQIKKLYLHKYDKDDLLMNWNVPLSRFGVKTGLDMARAGFACHISQAKRGRYHVDEAGKNDNRWFGLYYSSVGPDVKKNDFSRIWRRVIPWTACLFRKSKKAPPLFPQRRWAHHPPRRPRPHKPPPPSPSPLRPPRRNRPPPRKR